MIKYFTNQELTDITKQKKRVLTAYFVVLAVYLILSVGLLLWYFTLPYESETIGTVKWIHYPLTALFVVFSFIYLGIKYKRVKRYYKLCYNLSTGLRETTEGNFFEYSEDIQDKDGVDMKSLVFLEWNKYKKDFFERKVLVFFEKPFPELEENARVRYVTQGNVLIEYEIVEGEK